jgi:hypothetical protein
MMPEKAKGIAARARVAAALGALVLATLVSGCVNSSACQSGATVAGTSGEDRIIGCGSPYDEIYREIYTPGRGTDLGA